MFIVFEIMAFEHIWGISLNSEENTWERQSTCYQTVLRIHIRLKELFFNLICLGLMENWDESATMLISAVIVAREHVESPKVF